MKQIYVFNNVSWNYRKEARKERSCESYSASHIKKERSARFTAQPHALILADGPTLPIETLAVKNFENCTFKMICNLTAYYFHILNSE